MNTGFEYKIIGFDLNSLDELNKLGSDGWEAVGFVQSTTAIVRVLLKRPLESDQPFMLGV